MSTHQTTFLNDGLAGAYSVPNQKPTIDRRFRDWAEKNPHVIEAFCNIAERMVFEDGKTRVSARDIIGILREDADVEIISSDYRINNSFCAPLARLAEEVRPSLTGKFEFRVRTSQR